jgi:hypothetical protein
MLVSKIPCYKCKQCELRVKLTLIKSITLTMIKSITYKNIFIESCFINLCSLYIFHFSVLIRINNPCIDIQIINLVSFRRLEQEDFS